MGKYLPMLNEKMNFAALTMTSSEQLSLRGGRQADAAIFLSAKKTKTS